MKNIVYQFLKEEPGSNYSLTKKEQTGLPFKELETYNASQLRQQDCS